MEAILTVNVQGSFKPTLVMNKETGKLYRSMNPLEPDSSFNSAKIVRRLNDGSISHFLKEPVPSFMKWEKNVKKRMQIWSSLEKNARINLHMRDIVKDVLKTDYVFPESYLWEVVN